MNSYDFGEFLVRSIGATEILPLTLITIIGALSIGWSGVFKNLAGLWLFAIIYAVGASLYAYHEIQVRIIEGIVLGQAVLMLFFYAVGAVTRHIAKKA